MDRNSILIVDDDPEVRKTLSDILKLKGYVPATAATGKEALDRVKKEAPGVAVIDLKMEDISGLEVMKQIKKSSPGTECIILTGYASRESATEAVNLGAYGYLEKPYDMEQLLLIIRRAIQKQETEQALRESEGKYRVLFESKLDGMFVLDAETMTVVLANQTAAEIYGFSSVEEVIGVNPLDFVAPEGKERTLKIMVEDMFGKDMQEINEFRTITKDGKEKWISAVGTRIEYEGKLAGLVSFRDVTERGRAEEKLRESEEFSSSLLTSSPNPILVINRDTSMRYVNPALEKLTGFTSAELLGRKAPYPWWTEETLHKTRRDFEEAIHQGARKVEELFQKRDGERFWAQMTSEPVVKNGEFKYYLSNWVDITERKRAEEERAKVKATLRSLNAAALAVQRTLAPDDIFSTVAGELRKFGFLTTIFLLDEDQSNLMIAHISFSPELIKAAEKLTGLRLSNIRFPLDRIPQHIKKVLGNRVTVFSQDKERIEGFLPAHLKGLVGKLVEILGLQKGIIAPLVVEGKVVGALAVDSKELTEKDIAAVTAFANQVSIAIENARLCKATQQELAERKRAEEALRKSEEKYRKQFDEVMDAIFVADTETGILIDCNRAACELVGWEKAELVGKPQRDLHPPEKTEGEFSRTFKQHLKEKEGQILETQVITKKGEIKDVVIKANLFELSGRKVLQGSFRDITERKQAEQALRESEKHFRALIENSSDIIQIVDSEGIIRYLSPSVQRILGYKPEELIGRPSIDVVHPDDLPLVAKGFEEALQKPRVPVITACRCKHKDGTWRVIEGTGINQLDNPSVNGFIANMHDITERRRAVEELEGSKKRFQTLFNIMVDPVVIVDGKGKFLEITDRVEEITGFKKAELLGRNFMRTNIVTAKSKAILMKNLAKRMMGMRVAPYEIEVLRKDGRRLPYEVNAAKIEYEGKGADMVSFRDISERKKAEEALRESEEFSSSLLDSSPNPILVVNLDTSIRYVNPALEKLTGFTSSGLIGVKIPHPWWAEETRPQVQGDFEERMRKGAHRLEDVFKKKNGERFWVEITTRAIMRNGELQYHLSNWVDVTERKKAEEQLEHSFIELAETVSRAMGFRDPYTSSHQRRVAELARLVGEKIGLDKDRLRGLYIGGLLHDIGKISTPEAILSKPGDLTDEEWSLIHAHAKQGYLILKGTNLPWPVADMALHHHERLDGSGYPHGISGDRLSLEVRILGVCDVVEAMSSHRPYRPARSKEEVLEEIREGRGTKYDADVVDIMLEMIESGKLELFSQT